MDRKSELRPLLFLIYVSGLDDNITSNALKIADDTKVFRKFNNDDDDKQHLQNDLDKLVKRSQKLQMLLSFGKYKCLHTGRGNLDVNYTNVNGRYCSRYYKRNGLMSNNKC